MIYKISEYFATAIDCFVLIGFLIITLSFRKQKRQKKVLLIIGFSVLLFLEITFLNSITILEGIYTAFYFLILFCFCRIALQGKRWRQLLMILIAHTAVFLANAIVLTMTSFVLNEEYSNLLQMRNPIRILTLFLSKVVLFGLLLPIINFIQNERITLHFMQTIISALALMVSILSGIIIEKLLLEDALPIKYASIIMCSIVLIDTLLLSLVVLLSVRNKAILQQAALQTRLKDDEVKMQEILQWNHSVQTLQHDLNNHMIAIRQYIETGESKKALSYIEEITQSGRRFPKFTDTNNSILNAVVDTKRMICKDAGIDLKCYIQTDLLSFDVAAFNTIFGNLMDNAIEAEQRETQKEIRLSIEMTGTYLHLTIQNRTRQTVLKNGKMPNTTKSDKRNHGIGLNSVAKTIWENHGTIDYTDQNGWFVVDVLLTCNAN